MIKIAINGFGRIGRLVLRAGVKMEGVEFVGINDLTDPQTLAYLLKRDSVHGPFDGDVHAADGAIVVNGKTIPVSAEKDPGNLPWANYDTDIAIESTGRFRTEELARLHIKAGAKKVLMSAPCKEGNVKTIVIGVNEHEYDGEDVVSNASCTTNCFAPMAKVLNDNYKIKNGVMTTIHSYTNDQKLLDMPSTDLRRARSAGINIIPTTTGAAKAIGIVIPELEGKLIGSAIRVPTADASLCHFTAETHHKCNGTEDVNNLFKNVSEHHMPGILEYSDEPLVSSDIINNPHSCIFDSSLTKCIGDQIILVGWYDNEWGYANRMVDMAKLIGKKK